MYSKATADNVKQEETVDFLLQPPSEEIIVKPKKVKLETVEEEDVEAPPARLKFVCLPNPKYKCERCDDKILDTFEDFRKHKAEVHKKPAHQCDYCGKVFEQKYLMTTHLGSHVKTSCDVCGKFFHRFCIKIHRKAHFVAVKNRRKFECDFCGKVFLRKSKFNDHVKRATYHRFASIAWHCAFSKRQKFGSAALLAEHRKVHIGLNHFKCLKCNFRTQTEASLKKHIGKTHVFVYEG